MESMEAQSEMPPSSSRGMVTISLEGMVSTAGMKPGASTAIDAFSFRFPLPYQRFQFCFFVHRSSPYAGVVLPADNPPARDTSAIGWTRLQGYLERIKEGFN